MCKQVFAAFVTLLGLNAAAAAQTAPPPAAQAPDAHATCALPDLADSIDLQDVAGSDLVTMPVEINGKPKQFLLDIGTDASKISQATVDELHLTEGIKRTESVQAGPAEDSPQNSNRNMIAGATIQATIVDVKAARNVDDGRARVNIASFTLGTATGKNLQFVVANNSEIAKSAPYDGLMTGSFFKQYNVELDFVRNKLNYLTPTSCADPHQMVFWPHTEVAIIPMTMQDGKIQVQVAIQGNQINAVLDMSSARTVMRRDIAELKLGLKPDTPTMLPDGDREDGQGMQIYKAFLKQITFAGGVTAVNVPVQIQTNSMTRNLHRVPTLGSRAQFNAEPRIPDLILGMDVLHQLHLYVVPAEGNIYVTSGQ